MQNPLKKTFILGSFFLAVIVIYYPAFSQKNTDSPPSNKISNNVKTQKNISPEKSLENPENFFLDSKFSQQIFKRQGARRTDLVDYKKKGYIGETSEGLIAIRDINKLNPTLKKKIEKKVKFENKDRNRLYQAFIKRNKYNQQQEKTYRQNMFQSHLQSDPQGVYYRAEKEWLKK